MASVTLPLPCSAENPYGLPKSFDWNVIEEKLNQLKHNPTEENLLETIAYFIKTSLKCRRISESLGMTNDEYHADITWQSPREPLQLNGLKMFLTDHNSEEERSAFIQSTLPLIIDIALQMPALFPKKSIERLPSGIEDAVAFTRLQIACLVCHMFFCTVIPSADNIYGMTFEQWHCLQTFPNMVYLKVLFEYFSQITKEGNGEKCESTDRAVVYRRHVLRTPPKWEESRKPLLPVCIITNGKIGDFEEVETDFANKDIGYGISGTQEEIIFGMSPELCPAVLCCTTMLDNEAISMTGARTIGTFTGYGNSLKYTGPYVKARRWEERTVIAIDAIDFRNYCYGMSDEELIKLQLTSEHLHRELGKAYCGFSVAQNGRIGGGNWGCGVFKGDRGIKFIVQLLAASEANCKELIHYSFSDSTIADKFREFYGSLKSHDKTVGGLYTVLKDYTEFLEGKTSSEYVLVTDWYKHR